MRLFSLFDFAPTMPHGHAQKSAQPAQNHTQPCSLGRDLTVTLTGAGYETCDVKVTPSPDNLITRRQRLRLSSSQRSACGAMPRSTACPLRSQRASLPLPSPHMHADMHAGTTQTCMQTRTEKIEDMYADTLGHASRHYSNLQTHTHTFRHTKHRHADTHTQTQSDTQNTDTQTHIHEDTHKYTKMRKQAHTQSPT
jgi:hypothetical protein